MPVFSEFDLKMKGLNIMNCRPFQVPKDNLDDEVKKAIRIAKECASPNRWAQYGDFKMTGGVELWNKTKLIGYYTYLLEYKLDMGPNGDKTVFDIINDDFEVDKDNIKMYAKTSIFIDNDFFNEYRGE